MSRVTRALAHVDTTGLGLEIGPSYNPIAPKAAGYDVRIVDHTDREGLLTKYRKLGLSDDALGRIEEVDFVWQGEPLRKTISSGEEFAYVVAAHVVEHSVDLIGFLNECAEIVTDAGVVSLIVPDMRYCFDHFRPLTSAGQAVEAHLFPRTVHGPASFVDTHLYTVRSNGADTWPRGDTSGVQLAPCSWQGVQDTLAFVMPQDTYIDIHRWVFTPASFELLLHDLYHLGHLDLVVDAVAAPGGFEFFATLRRPGPADTAPGSDPAGVASPYRRRMLRRVEQEIAEGRLDTPPRLRDRARNSARAARRRAGRLRRRG